MKKFNLSLVGLLLLSAVSGWAQDNPYFVPSTGIAVRATSGDLNNDGIVDLAWITSDTDSLFTMLGNGDGTFNPASRRARVVPNIFLISLAMGNFNHNIDGNLDIVVVNAAFGGVGSAMVFYGNGTGAVGAPQILTGFNVGAGDVVVADFDPLPVPPFTSNLDIAATFPPGNGVRVYFGDGNGNFTGTNFTTGGTTPTHLDVAVLPSCGAFACPANLVVSNPGSGNVGVLISNGVGGFSAAVPIGSGLDRGVAWIDFNGDGFLDIAAGRPAANGGARVYFGTNSTGIAYNPTPLELTTPNVLHYRDVCAGDFNGDGNADLFGASDVVLGGSGLTTFFLNNGAGGFSAGKDDTLGVFINFTSCEAADINANGLPDLLLGTVGSDSVTIYNLQAPSVSPSIITTGNPSTGAPFPLPVITARDSTNIASVELMYRQMGQTAYSTLPLTAVSGGTPTQRDYTGTLPASALTNRGLEYVFRTSDGFVTANIPFNRFIRLSTSIAENAPATFNRSYQLVSLPMRFSGSNGTPSIQIADDFSLTDSNVARLFWWDPVLADTITTNTTSLKGYREFPFPGLTNFAFTPGRSMFLATAGSKVFDGVGLSTLPNVTLQRPTPFGDSVPVDYYLPLFALDSGWNMIATPFPYTVHFDSVDVIVPDIDFDIHEVTDPVRDNRIGSGSANLRERTTSGYIAPSPPLLKPWRGYFLKNNGPEQVLLLVPKLDGNFPLTAPPAPKPYAAGLDWKIDIFARSGETEPPPTTFGTSKAALREYDRMDWEFPPGLPGDLRVAFQRDKEFGQAGDYLTDIRPTLTESETWDFTVEPGGTRAIEMNFDGLADIPEDYDVILTDKEGRAKQNLRTEPAYRFIASQDRHFELTIAPKITGQVALLPTKYDLHQNFPNPFNPQTLIKYDLPEATAVRLEVFNILGQKVTTLVNRFEAAGPKSVVWDGSDESGAKVSSGIYFYKIAAGGFSATQKMMLVK